MHVFLGVFRPADLLSNRQQDISMVGKKISNNLESRIFWAVPNVMFKINNNRGRITVVYYGATQRTFRPQT